MATTIAVEARMRANSLFNQSRDFQLAWKILTDGEPQGEAKSHVPWPLRAPVTCACMALELALKSLITLEGGTPASVHWAEDLFKQVTAASQNEIAAMLQVDGKPADVPSLLTALHELDDGAPGATKRVPPLEAWRYTHEHQTVQHAQGTMYVITRALHDLLVRRRPDWDPWPGIIAR
jgi:hypothetical protein